MFFNPNHCQEHGMTYKEHMKFALKFGFISILHGKLVLIHAFLPFLFEDSVERLYRAMEDMVNDKYEKLGKKRR